MINFKIPTTSSLEIIRNAIYSVLSSEFDAQAYQYQNAPFFGINFFQARTTPLDKSESAAIVISTFKGMYDNQSVGSQHGHYTFVIDFMANAASTPTVKGYESAEFRVEQIMMMTRYILMHPEYITLKLTGIIEHTEVSNFQVYKDERQKDASDTASAQLMFNVRCEETTTPNNAILLAESDTTVFIELTEQGYKYQKNTHEY